jgi:hypothetical protein
MVRPRDLASWLAGSCYLASSFHSIVYHTPTLSLCSDEEEAVVL